MPATNQFRILCDAMPHPKMKTYLSFCMNVTFGSWLLRKQHKTKTVREKDAQQNTWTYCNGQDVKHGWNRQQIYKQTCWNSHRETSKASATCKVTKGDQKVSVHLHSVYSNNPHITDELQMAITEYIRNMNRAIPSTVFENRFRHVNKCLETGRGHFDHYL